MDEDGASKDMDMDKDEDRSGPGWADPQRWAALSSDELEREARLALVVSSPEPIQAMAKEWAARARPVSELDGFCEDAGFSMGFVDYCWALQLHKAVDAMLFSGLARWEDTREGQAVAKAVAQSDGAGDEGLGLYALWIKKWVLNQWAQALDPAGERWRSGAKPKTSRQADVESAGKLAVKFCRRAPGYKEQFEIGARAAMDEIASAGVEWSIDEERSGASKRLEKALPTLDRIGLGGDLVESLQPRAQALKQELRDSLEQALRAEQEIRPWSEAARAAFSHDSAPVLMALVEGARKVGAPVLGPKAGAYTNYENGEIESGRARRCSWIWLCVTSEAWSCVGELARIGASTGLAIKPDRPFNPLNGFVHSSFATPAASEAMAQVALAMAREIVEQGKASDPAEAARMVGALAGEAGANARGRRPESHAQWDRAELRLDEALRVWSGEASSAPAPSKPVPRL